MKNLKVGVIGLGFGKHHARIYNSFPNTDLIAISDLDPSKIKYIDQSLKEIPFYTDYLDLLKIDLDIINVVVPTRQHYSIAKHFLKQGINCFIEKPIAYTLKEAEELVQLAHNNSVKLAIGHIETFNPAIVKLKQILSENILGEIKHISTRRVGPFVERVLDIGIMMDSATHDVGIMYYLLNKIPKTVFSKFWCIKNPKGDYAVLVFDFGDKSGCIEVNWFTPTYIRTLEITGTNGYAHLDYADQSLSIYTEDYNLIPSIVKQEPLTIELKHFVDCIVNNEMPLISGEVGYQILKIVLEAGAQ